MDDKTQKEKLEQELSFLKESFDAEVISKEEYEKGKQRIEKKLKEIGAEIGAPVNSAGNEADESINKAENPIAATPQQEDQLESTTEKESATEKSTPEEVSATEKEEPKKQTEFFKYFAILIALVIVILLSYYLLKAIDSKSNVKANEANEAKAANEVKSAAASIIKTNVLILNDKDNCFNCDTQRVLGILEGWFGAVNAEEINHSTQKGMELTEKFGIEALPAYILDDNIEKSKNYEQFKQAFVKKDKEYILSESAAGSTFYLRREPVPNKLDLFIISGDATSAKAESNLKEFLDAFREVKFAQHTSDEGLTKELRIKNFPTFLINNRVKFSGVNTAETIKENFCKINKLEGCEKRLSKSLI